MDPLINEVFEYIKITWAPKVFTVEQVPALIEPYDKFLASLIPDSIPLSLRKYIHKERLLYDLYMADRIMVYRFDPKDFTEESDSFYSNSELMDDQDKLDQWINGVRLMDEFDYREQLSANQFTGGYWDPSHHWVIQKKNVFPRYKLRK